MSPLIEFERNTPESELMKYKMIYHGNRNVRPMFIVKKTIIDIREMHILSILLKSFKSNWIFFAPLKEVFVFSFLLVYTAK